MKQGEGLCEQGILFFHAHRSHVAYLLIVEVRLNLIPEVSRILHNAGDQQLSAALAGGLDRQVDTFIRMYPADEDEMFAPGFALGIKREIDSVVDRCQVIEPGARSESLIETKYPVAVFLIDRHDARRGEAVDGG